MKHAQVECAAHPYAPNCLFADIASFLRPGLQGTLEELQQNDQLQTVLQPLVEKDRATVASLGGRFFFVGGRLQ